MYLSWLWSVIFFSTLLTFVSQSVFLTRLLTLGILFSTAVNAEVGVKPLILRISALTSFILVLRRVLVAKLVISDILSSIFFILVLYSVFLTTWFFYYIT